MLTPGVVYTYESGGIEAGPVAGVTTQETRDLDLMQTGTYRGARFIVPVEGGTRLYRHVSTQRVDPWQNKAVAAIGVFLAILGLTGLVLEKKLSRFQ
jgi:hypothetical protein